MTGFVLCVLAFMAVWRASRRSTGHGLGALFAVGYAYGILRANFPDGFSHFLFDAAVAGLYVGNFTGPGARRSTGPNRVRVWAYALIAWPALLMLVPSQHFLVQLVGLRAAAWFLPCVLIGARCGGEELRQMARWLAGLNLVALLFGLAELVLGVERFYPYNAVTDLIYRSSDVGPQGDLRIPAVFPNAHAYGGTMVDSLPLLLGAWSQTTARREQTLYVAGAFAAVLGVFLCAARQPVVYLLVLGIVFLFSLPLTSRRRVTALLVIALVAGIVSTNERFQRSLLLTDTEKVAGRVQGSLNMSFVELLLEHPMGEGLASAAGTSIPFFMEGLAKPQIGMENEWGRIALEQSLLGLGLWVAFIGATLAQYPRAKTPWLVARRLIWTLVGMLWATAFIGTGMLTSIPSTTLLLVFMGVLWGPLSVRARSPRPARGGAQPAAAGSPQAVAA